MDELNRYIAPKILPSENGLTTGQKAKKVFVNIGENIAVVAHRVKHYFIHRYETGKWEWLDNRAVTSLLKERINRSGVQLTSEKVKQIAEKLKDAGALSKEQSYAIVEAQGAVPSELGERFKQLGEGVLKEGEYLVIHHGTGYELFYKKETIQSKMVSFESLGDAINDLNLSRSVSIAEANEKTKLFSNKKALQKAVFPISAELGRAGGWEFAKLEKDQGFLVNTDENNYSLYFRDKKDRINRFAFHLDDDGSLSDRIHYIINEAPQLAMEGQTYEERPNIEALIEHFDLKLLDREAAVTAMPSYIRSQPHLPSP